MLEDNIDDKRFSILDVSAEFDKVPWEDRMPVSAQVALPLVGNFPSKVPLCHACSLRDFVEKKKTAEFDSKSNKTFAKMMFWCWEKTISSAYNQKLWAVQERATKLQIGKH